MNYNQYTTKKVGAFTLIELLVVIAIIGLLAGIATPAVTKSLESAKRRKSGSNIRQIVLGCQNFASDNYGVFPNFDPEADSDDREESFTTSEEAFNVLIPEYVDVESVFWQPTPHPDKQRPPVEDADLEAEENVYLFVSSMTNTSYTNSPLVADGHMDRPGEFNDNHPWLESKRAVIGFVGGHAEELILTSRTAGATAKTRDGRTENVFEEREIDDEGKASGGWLDTETDNVLLPGS
ncbi:MAG: type II secretion system protein [Verrucomicrobiota bacterium]